MSSNVTYGFSVAVSLHTMLCYFYECSVGMHMKGAEYFMRFHSLLSEALCANVIRSKGPDIVVAAVFNVARRQKALILVILKIKRIAHNTAAIKVLIPIQKNKIRMGP